MSLVVREQCDAGSKHLQESKESLKSSKKAAADTAAFFDPTILLRPFDAATGKCRRRRDDMV